MTYEQFCSSLKQGSPPADVSVYLQSLWYDAKGDWDQSHELIQHLNDKTAAWIHAYLHRKEGDTFNANYWYNRAARRMPGYSLEKEWEEITNELLQI
jgi:hypothetical protein